MTDAKANRAARRRKRKGRKSNMSLESKEQLGESAPPQTSPPPSPPPNPKRRKVDAPSNSKSRPGFLEKMRMRLTGGHFRMLNEKLYTCSGNEAFDFFKNDPQLFDVYHAGYQEQMLHWPEKPVNTIIKWLKKHSSSWVVADFGCGSATIAKNVKNKVFSIDLVSNDPSVIACDMAHTPLNSSSVDVAVFCLSLMGTNYPNYLDEARRVLKPSGQLLIAEVRSRFDPNNGGADPKKFFEAVNQLGFSLSSKDFSNKMFVLLYFKKTERNSQVQNIEWPELKPCIYKRR
ncbi:hypothetical protein Cni_G09637 [Canna indica]|uniref:Ribosomal RNA-processing protein 8 n=1 Tax=Canna indica TaxID=4628 RepID=A0AAQ3K2P7_9LILI|nr:hypothetical protein Cni_G09637 [Canna indica]